MNLSPLACLLLSCVAPEVLAAHRAGIVGRAVYEAAVQAAAYVLITHQDETVDLRNYVAKVEAAVNELVAK